MLLDLSMAAFFPASPYISGRNNLSLGKDRRHPTDNASLKAGPLESRARAAGCAYLKIPSSEAAPAGNL